MLTPEIKELAKSILSPFAWGTCLMFGSHARGDADRFSDYDFLLIVKDKMSPHEKVKMASRLRSRFAESNVDADIVIKTPEEIEYYKDKAGHVVKNALLEGIPAW